MKNKNKKYANNSIQIIDNSLESCQISQKQTQEQFQEKFTQNINEISFCIDDQNIWHQDKKTYQPQNTLQDTNTDKKPEQSNFKININDNLLNQTAKFNYFSHNKIQSSCQEHQDKNQKQMKSNVQIEQIPQKYNLKKIKTQGLLLQKKNISLSNFNTTKQGNESNENTQLKDISLKNQNNFPKNPQNLVQRRKQQKSITNCFSNQTNPYQQNKQQNIVSNEFKLPTKYKSSRNIENLNFIKQNQQKKIFNFENMQFKNLNTTKNQSQMLNLNQQQQLFQQLSQNTDRNIQQNNNDKNKKMVILTEQDKKILESRRSKSKRNLLAKQQEKVVQNLFSQQSNKKNY
ncbi:hypothetical protein PPERSA_01057 [Pseudocohnilembus persalinus]|uniref:Uncharacterized protein n=1 Tax=Pseudocohnilembus persalinus TaxID=266149 RepID=A0A0V0QUQ2_PSEPJ|nr:hypothetical protein PPERSA_01057 [Pseudocohnilembus persalinus]|eukprot:KRX05979.1 hypothetical protein PPERSA_01057 [Pseudocohnilembus persalinus]